MAHFFPGWYDETSLETFENNIPEQVFLDVTSITISEFKFLRDGGDYEDENGEKKHYEGHLFDSVVFNLLHISFTERSSI